jgi:hypothetical protein
MMNFRVINQAILDTLGAAAAGRFRAVGYQRHGKAASEVRGNNRLVQSYYSSGEFPKSGGRQTGSTKHDMSFTIGFTVSAPARLNLTVLNSEAATAGQKAAALAALQEAAYVADTDFDELVEIAYQIIMDARNFDLGLAKGTMSNRWVEALHKDAPEPQGELVVLTGTMTYSCTTSEDVTGDTGVPASGEWIDTVIDIDGDDVERTGVSVRQVDVVDGYLFDAETGAQLVDAETGAVITIA